MKTKIVEIFNSKDIRQNKAYFILLKVPKIVIWNKYTYIVCALTLKNFFNQKIYDGGFSF